MSNLPIIYVVDGSVAITGAFISARSNAEILSEQASIELVLPSHSVIPLEALGSFNVLSTIPMQHPSKRLLAMLRYLPTLLKGAWQLRTRMKRDDVQHLILNDFYLMHGVILRLLGYRGRIITWVRCEPKRFAGPLAGIMIWLQLVTANRIVTVSQFIRNLLPAHADVAIIPNMYQGRRRHPRTWQTSDEKTFLYVGNYIEGKGQDVGLRAFAIAAASDPTIRLHFVGDDMGLAKNKAFRAHLGSMAQELGVASRVTFSEFVSDTFPLLETSFAALNCSVSESFSRTVLEASGAGVPVIATASGGPQEILVEGETGFLEPVGDVEGIARRMTQLAQQPELAAQMGEAGARRIAKQFAMETVREQLKELLNS